MYLKYGAKGDPRGPDFLSTALITTQIAIKYYLQNILNLYDSVIS